LNKNVLNTSYYKEIKYLEDLILRQLKKVVREKTTKKEISRKRVFLWLIS
jgi:hypothetical protein